MNRWRVGDKVRYIRGSYTEYGPDIGSIGTIERLRADCLDKPREEYQVFWVRMVTGAIYWTVPDDVEYVE